MDDGGIGVAEPSTSAISIGEQDLLTGAVRETVRTSVLDLLRRRGPIASAELIECPGCGDRVIHLDSPNTFAFDHRRNARICRACAAERDLIQMMRPAADIGGEGGA